MAGTGFDLDPVTAEKLILATTDGETSALGGTDPDLILQSELLLSWKLLRGRSTDEMSRFLAEVDQLVTPGPSARNVGTSESFDQPPPFVHRPGECLLLGEEIGELFKAVRKHERLPVGTTSIVGTVDEELADVLIFVCAVANRYGINLAEALRRKEAHNEQRVWS